MATMLRSSSARAQRASSRSRSLSKARRFAHPVSGSLNAALWSSSVAPRHAFTIVRSIRRATARWPGSTATKPRSCTSCSIATTGEPTRAPHLVAAAARLRLRSIGTDRVVARFAPRSAGEASSLTRSEYPKRRERLPAAAPSARRRRSRSSKSARPESQWWARHRCHHSSASAPKEGALGTALLGSGADGSTARTYHRADLTAGMLAAQSDCSWASTAAAYPAGKLVRQGGGGNVRGVTGVNRGRPIR